MGFSFYNMFIMRVTEKKLAANRANSLLGGRPVGAVEGSTLHAKLIRDVFVKKVFENAEPLAKAMLRKAKGGDVAAFVALMDRAIGKPAQAVEMSGKDGNPIVFMPLELIQKHALQVAADVVKDEPKRIIESQDNGSIKP